jgi:hypothetical protein
MHELTYFISYERGYCYGWQMATHTKIKWGEAKVCYYSDTVGEQIIQYSWQYSKCTVKGWWVGFSMRTCHSGISQTNDTQQNEGSSSPLHNISVHNLCCSDQKWLYFFWMFSICIFNIYTHPNVIMTPKTNVGASGSKGVKMKHVTLTVSNKLMNQCTSCQSSSSNTWHHLVPMVPDYSDTMMSTEQLHYYYYYYYYWLDHTSHHLSAKKPSPISHCQWD